jgi:hypothetical protein
MTNGIMHLQKFGSLSESASRQQVSKKRAKGGTSAYELWRRAWHERYERTPEVARGRLQFCRRDGQDDRHPVRLELVDETWCLKSTAWA